MPVTLQAEPFLTSVQKSDKKGSACSVDTTLFPYEFQESFSNDKRNLQAVYLRGHANKKYIR